MSRQTITSIKIVSASLIPIGIISNIFEYILVKNGLLYEITDLALALLDFSKGNYKAGLFGLFFSLLLGFFIIIFLAWALRKLTGGKPLNPQAWQRTFIWGILLGFMSPLKTVLPSEFLRIIIPIIIFFGLTWLLFHNYSFTIEKDNESV